MYIRNIYIYIILDKIVYKRKFTRKRIIWYLFLVKFFRYFIFQFLYANFITSITIINLLTSNWNERHCIHVDTLNGMYRNTLIVITKLRRHLLGINCTNIYSIESKFFEFLSVSHVFFFIDKHRYLFIQIYLSTKRKLKLLCAITKAAPRERVVSNSCVHSRLSRWRVEDRGQWSKYNYTKKRNKRMRRNYFSLRWIIEGIPLKLDNNRLEKSRRHSELAFLTSLYLVLCFF